MRNILLFALVATLFSCNSKDEYIPEEVNFTVDYQFEQSGAMRSTGDAVYDSFFDKFIKPDKLRPLLTILNLKIKKRIPWLK